jgi:hypothetical protein
MERPNLRRDKMELNSYRFWLGFKFKTSFKLNFNFGKFFKRFMRDACETEKEERSADSPVLCAQPS